MSRSSELNEALDNLQAASADIEGCAVVSEDGLIIASALQQGLEEDHVAAISAVMLSMGSRITMELKKGALEQLFVKGDKGYVIMSSAGEHAVLVAITRVEDSGVASCRSLQVVRRLSGDPLEALEEPVECLQTGRRFFDRRFAEEDRATVVGAEEEETDPLPSLLGDEFGQAAGALGAAHLAAVVARVAFGSATDLACGRVAAQQAVVRPVLGHRLAMAALALRDLVLVVREDQVEPAAVDVE